MHAGRAVAIVHAMRPRQVEKPAFPRRHRHALAIKEKVHVRRAQQRNMQTQIRIRLSEIIVAMFMNLPART